jgi:hypothetical protein
MKEKTNDFLSKTLEELGNPCEAYEIAKQKKDFCRMKEIKDNLWYDLEFHTKRIAKELYQQLMLNAPNPNFDFLKKEDVLYYLADSSSLN